MAKFLHPIHARGVQAQRIPTPLTSLTDAKIDEYIRQGFYGETRKQALLACEAEQKARKASMAKGKRSSSNEDGDGESTGEGKARNVSRSVDDMLEDII